jgi:tripartite-type tricarboxylate transporter receptor subunit TctC
MAASRRQACPALAGPAGDAGADSIKPTEAGGNMTRARTIAIAALVAAGAVAQFLCMRDPAAAQTSPVQMWPTRPVTMVVPFGAGGAADVMARALAPRLAELLGPQIIVENVGGAGGTTGAARIAKAPPDGSQFLLGNAGTQAISQTLYKQPPYNSVTDFVPVGMVAQSYFVLITRKDLPAATLPEFTAYARANQAKMQYASAGVGSTSHMLCVLLNSVMGVEITHVPYRSTIIAFPDMMAGRIDFICDAVETAGAQIRGNTVKAIAVLAPGRSTVLPGVPTAAEQGVAGLAVSGWYGLFLPRGTPDAIVHRLSSAASAALDTPSVRERIESVGINMVPAEQRTPDYLARMLPAEIEKWAVPVRASGLSVD